MPVNCQIGRYASEAPLSMNLSLNPLSQLSDMLHYMLIPTVGPEGTEAVTAQRLAPPL